MIRSISNVRTYAAIQDTNVLILGVPEGKKYTLLEIRVPSDSIQLTYVTMTVGGMRRASIIPTVDDFIHTLGDDVEGATEVRINVNPLVANAQIIGVTLVYETNSDEE